MSDEESFVILGSSPMSSLESDGIEAVKRTNVSSLESDTPGSRFTVLRNSQLIDLTDAQKNETTDRKFDIEPEMTSSRFMKHGSAEMRSSEELKNSFIENSTMEGSSYIKYLSTEMPSLEDNDKFQFPSKAYNKFEIEPQMSCESMKKSDFEKLTVTETKETEEDKENAAAKLWRRTPQVQVNENKLPLSLEDCALKFPLEQQQKQKGEESVQQKGEESVQQKADTSINQTGKASKVTSLNSNLAASFIMGEIDSDVLKTSVYSQFPSISMEASPEDVVKLQSMVAEYSDLKTTIKKANNTMRLFYQSSLTWRDKLNTLEEHYKEQMDECKNEIEELRKKNNELETNYKSQIDAIETARRKDRDESIKEISEKNAVIENMRAQIIKLEELQLASFDFVQQKGKFNKTKTTPCDHEAKIINLQKEISESLALNLDLKDLEKQYLDEINWLRVNLTAAEEILTKNRSDLAKLKTLNEEKNQQILALDASLELLHLTCNEQKERIGLLESQNEVHRADFEMEKQSRETVVKEKQQLLQDLRSLQKRNQELIEEQQKIADGFQKRLSSVAASNDAHITSASIAAQSYFNNPQRPIRALPTSPTAASKPSNVSLHLCPICNKAFKTLPILLSHVDNCIDKTV